MFNINHYIHIVIVFRYNWNLQTFKASGSGGDGNGKLTTFGIPKAYKIKKIIFKSCEIKL